MRRFLAVCALVACGGHAPSAALVELPQPGAAQSYAIRLHRPSHVGDAAHVVLTGAVEHMTTSRLGAEIVEDRRDVKRGKLEGTATVLAVDARRKPLRIAYDASLELERDGAHEALVRRGRIEVTRAPKAEDATVTVDGAPAGAEIREAVDLVVSLDSGGSNDDEIFGTSRPQTIGAHWPIDARRATAELGSGDDAVRGGTVSGDVWLQGLERIDGVDCLDVSSRLVLEGMDVPDKSAGTVVEASRATASFSGAFPIDADLPRLRDRLVIELTFKLRKPSPSGDILVEVDAVDRHEGRYTPLGLTARAGDAR